MVEFGLVPANITGDQGNLLLGLVSLVTYQFLHGGWVHLGVNMLSLAAFGAPVERLLGVRRFVFFYLSAGIVAAAVHVVFFSDSPDPVIGASGAISGVFGAVLMLMRQVGSLSSSAAGRRDLDRAQRVLRHLRRHARRRRRAGRLDRPYRRLHLWTCRHSSVRAATALLTYWPEWRSAAGCAIARRYFGRA